MLTGYLNTFATALWLTPDCSVADNPLHCRLLTWLSALEAAAGVLAFLLVLTALFAFVAVRRNKTRKLERSAEGNSEKARGN
jgi:hypothetical protein